MNPNSLIIQLLLTKVVKDSGQPYISRCDMDNLMRYVLYSNPGFIVSSEWIEFAKTLSYNEAKIQFITVEKEAELDLLFAGVDAKNNEETIDLGSNLERTDELAHLHDYYIRHLVNSRFYMYCLDIDQRTVILMLMYAINRRYLNYKQEAYKFTVTKTVYESFVLIYNQMYEYEKMRRLIEDSLVREAVLILNEQMTESGKQLLLLRAADFFIEQRKLEQKKKEQEAEVKIDPFLMNPVRNLLSMIELYCNNDNVPGWKNLNDVDKQSIVNWLEKNYDDIMEDIDRKSALNIQTKHSHIFSILNTTYISNSSCIVKEAMNAVKILNKMETKDREQIFRNASLFQYKIANAMTKFQWITMGNYIYNMLHKDHPYRSYEMTTSSNINKCLTAAFDSRRIVKSTSDSDMYNMYSSAVQNIHFYNDHTKAINEIAKLSSTEFIEMLSLVRDWHDLSD